MSPQTQPIDLGGVYTPPGTNLKLERIGCGATHLSAPMARGSPNDRDAVVAAIREVAQCGVNHIETSDMYVISRSDGD